MLWPAPPRAERRRASATLGNAGGIEQACRIGGGRRAHVAGADTDQAEQPAIGLSADHRREVGEDDGCELRRVLQLVAAVLVFTNVLPLLESGSTQPGPAVLPKPKIFVEPVQISTEVADNETMRDNFTFLLRTDLIQSRFLNS